VNKKELKNFYQNRLEFLHSLDNGSMNFKSIDETNIYDKYIDEKRDNPILIIGNFPKAKDKLIIPPNALKLLKANLSCEYIDFKKDVILTNSFPFVLTEHTITSKLIDRAPNQMEALGGSILLQREIELIQPRIIITLGNSALISLKYAKCERFVNSLDDLSLNFLLDTYLDFLQKHIVVGYTHYPSSLNMKNLIKLEEFTKFFNNIKIIIKNGYNKYLESLTTKDFKGFEFNDFARSVINEIEKSNKLITPETYKEYFFKLLKYQDENLKENVKQILLAEK
jgi:uracil-DNA glycosylase